MAEDLLLSYRVPPGLGEASQRWVCWSLLALGAGRAGLESSCSQAPCPGQGRGAWLPYSGLGKASLFLTLDLHAVLRITAPGLFMARERQRPEGLPALHEGKDTSDEPALYRGWGHCTKASQNTAAEGESKGYLKRV